MSSEQLQRLRRKWLTPIRMVLAGTLSVVISTVFWLLHLRDLSQAELLLATAPKLAESALAEGDLAEAARQFGSTKSALDTLGRDDRQARLWRQLARESAAGAELVSSSLPEILQEAVEANGSSTWSDTFRSMYKGSWVVFDAPVSRSSLADVAPRYSIDYPIRFGEVEGVIWVNELPALESRVPAGEKPQRVIFAAQLAAIRREPGSEQTWRIELRGDTAFLWCTPDALAPLGLPPDAATQTLLNEQAQSLGIDP